MIRCLFGTLATRGSSNSSDSDRGYIIRRNSITCITRNDTAIDGMRTGGMKTLPINVTFINIWIILGIKITAAMGRYYRGNQNEKQEGKGGERRMTSMAFQKLKEIVMNHDHHSHNSHER